MFNQPKGLIPAALSNMGERFGYYIMNAVLTLFLCVLSSALAKKWGD